jgi:hypothetical protein
MSPHYDQNMKTITTTHGNPGPMDAMPGEAEMAPLDLHKRWAEADRMAWIDMPNSIIAAPLEADCPRGAFDVVWTDTPTVIEEPIFKDNSSAEARLLAAEARLMDIAAIIRKARRLSDDNALLLPDEVEKVYALATGSAEP